MMKMAVAAVVVGTLAACAPVEKQSSLEQEVGAPLSTHAGGTVLRVNKMRDLPNAFGRADLFGRKVNEGFSELRYLGIGEQGLPVFHIKEQQIVSNETTMSRTPMAFANTQGSFSGTVTPTPGGATVSGTSNSSTTVVLPQDSTTVALPPTGTAFVYDENDGPLIFEGYRLEVLSAQPHQLSYRIETQ